MELMLWDAWSPANTPDKAMEDTAMKVVDEDAEHDERRDVEHVRAETQDGIESGLNGDGMCGQAP
jgi:hypothetical protein